MNFDIDYDLIGQYKTRDQQEAEIKEYFEPYASMGCKKYYGTGREYWIQDLGQYKICDCIMENITRIKKNESIS